MESQKLLLIGPSTVHQSVGCSAQTLQENTPNVSNLRPSVGQTPDLSTMAIPFIMKDKVIMSPGTWNGIEYSPAELHKAFQNTDWADSRIRSNFYEHNDNDAPSWIGEVVNPHMVGNNLVADLHFVDDNAARKVAYGAKFGISPKLHGDVPDGTNAISDFVYDNFSTVWTPACSDTYLNSATSQSPKHKYHKEDTKMSEDETKKSSTEELASVMQQLNDTISKTMESGFDKISDKLDKVIKNADEGEEEAPAEPEAVPPVEEPEETPAAEEPAPAPAEPPAEEPAPVEPEAPAKETTVENSKIMDALTDIQSKLKAKAPAKSTMTLGQETPKKKELTRDELKTQLLSGPKEVREGLYAKYLTDKHGGPSFGTLVRG